VTCTRCPFSLVCLMGRLGHPYPVRLCPKCQDMCFVVDTHTLGPFAPPDAHVFHFRCEKRAIPRVCQEDYDHILSQGSSKFLSVTNVPMETGPHKFSMNIPDPVGTQRLLQVRLCIACLGQMPAGRVYSRVFMHQLDSPEGLRDALP